VASRAVPLDPVMASLVQVASPTQEAYHYTHQVVFLRWETVVGNPRTTRPVRLDAMDKVIYNVPFAVKIERFRTEHTTIIVADVPVHMDKRTVRVPRSDDRCRACASACVSAASLLWAS